MMKVTFKTISNQAFQYDLDENFTILEIKQKISTEKGVPIDSQKLIYNGKVLIDSDPLHHINYNEQKFIVWLVHLKPLKKNPIEKTEKHKFSNEEDQEYQQALEEVEEAKKAVDYTEIELEQAKNAYSVAANTSFWGNGWANLKEEFQAQAKQAESKLAQNRQRCQEAIANLKIVKRKGLKELNKRIFPELLGDVLLFFEASEVEKCRYTCLWWKQVIDNRRKILPFKPTTRPEPPSKQPFNYWLEDELLDAYGQSDLDLTEPIRFFYKTQWDKLPDLFKMGYVQQVELDRQQYHYLLEIFRRFCEVYGNPEE